MIEFSNKEKSKEKLKEELISVLREQFNLRMQVGSGQLKRFHLLRKTRNRIASIKTSLSKFESL